MDAETIDPKEFQELRQLFGEVTKHTLKELKNIHEFREGLPEALSKWMEANVKHIREQARKDAEQAIAAAKLQSAGEVTKLADRAAQDAGQALAIAQLSRDTLSAHDVDQRVAARVSKAVAELRDSLTALTAGATVEACGKWQAKSYHMNSIVQHRGASFIAREGCDAKEIPGSSKKWMLLAKGGGGGGTTIIGGGGGGGVDPAVIESLGFIRGDSGVIDGGFADGGGA